MKGIDLTFILRWCSFKTERASDMSCCQIPRALLGANFVFNIPQSMIDGFQLGNLRSRSASSSTMAAS
jgi:hypothetical protein